MEKLACLVLYYGGRLQLRLDAAVTHLVTMDTTGVRPLFAQLTQQLSILYVNISLANNIFSWFGMFVVVLCPRRSMRQQ